MAVSVGKKKIEKGAVAENLKFHLPSRAKELWWPLAQAGERAAAKSKRLTAAGPAEAPARAEGHL